MKDIIEPPEKERFEDVYIVYELMDTDLHQIIRSTQTLTDDHCQVMISGHIHFLDLCRIYQIHLHNNV